MAVKAFFKKYGIFFAAVAAAVLVAVAVCDEVFNKTAEKNFFAMDTVVTVKLKGKDAEKCLEQIEKCVTDLDGVLNRHDSSSEISLVNQNKGGSLSKKTAEYFRLLLDVSKKSGGAFDFTLGAVSDLWSFGNNPEVPDDAALKKALSECGYEKVSVDGNNITVTGGVIDFGAAGKGIALDEIRSILGRANIKEAVVSVGGSVLICSKKDVTVGIRDPFGNAGRSIATLSLNNGCVSTSGSYERYFEENGKNYHHIIDPETGYPVDNGLISVTVVSQSGALSDILSTACFVLGIEDGKALAEEYGCEVVFITEDKKIIATDGIADKLEITDKDYKYEK